MSRMIAVALFIYSLNANINRRSKTRRGNIEYNRLGNNARVNTHSARERGGKQHTPRAKILIKTRFN
jgi:hypothetical protein